MLDQSAFSILDKSGQVMLPDQSDNSNFKHIQISL